MANYHKQPIILKMKTNKKLTSKAKRLAWLSLEHDESGNLIKVLTNGEVIKLNKDNKPMLVQ